MKALRRIENVRQVSRHRQFIYGAAAWMILFFHWGTNIPNRGALKILRLLQDLGCCGVEMFLLLSGFGLVRALEKNPDPVRFLSRRIARVLPPLIVCGICFDIVLYSGPYAAAVGKGFMLDYLMSSAVWYVSFIVLMYLAFPLVNRIRRSCPAALWAAVVLFTVLSFAIEAAVSFSRESAIMRMVSRIPVFLLGCALAPWETESRPISRAALPVLALLSAALIAAWRVNLLPACDYSLRMLCFTACAMTLILLLAAFAEAAQKGKICRFVSFCGAYSLEIYLVFARVRAVMEMIPGWGAYASLKMDLAAAALSIPLSALLGRLCAAAMGRILAGRK